MGTERIRQRYSDNRNWCRGEKENVQNSDRRVLHVTLGVKGFFPDFLGFELDLENLVPMPGVRVVTFRV